MTIFIILLIILIIKRFVKSAIKINENTESPLSNNDDSNSKYGTVESKDKNKNETNRTIKTSLSWPYNTFLLRKLISKNQLELTSNSNKSEYSLKDIELNNELVKSQDVIKSENETTLNEVLLSKLNPIKLNYSIKYEESSLKLEIISLEFENKANVFLNSYIRIELVKIVNEQLFSNINEAFEIDDQHCVYDTNQYKVCKTRIIRNELHPVYNETFFFNDLISLSHYELLMTVYGTNKFTRDTFIGQLKHSFESSDNQKYHCSLSRELAYHNKRQVSRKCET